MVPSGGVKPAGKKNTKPPIKMRAFHWNVVQPKQLEGTIWKGLTDDSVVFDVKQFEVSFSVKDAPKPVKGAEGSADEEKKKKQVIELIDSKRSYNINIALARFRMTHAAIRDAILAMDEIVLGEDKVSALLKCAPTEEELEQVKEYHGEEDLLGNTEKFFRTIANIPRVDKRLECFFFKMKFSTYCEEHERSVTFLELASRALKGSQNLKTLLEYMLALGNYLNGGTTKGGAYGFKLDTINKLKSTKSSDNKSTLLHFLVKTVDTKNKTLRAFVDELSCLHPASRVETAILASDVAKLRASLNKVDAEIKKCDQKDATDRFYTVMSVFNEIAERRVVSIEERVKQLDSVATTLSTYFGESDKMKLEELFKLFADFVADYKEAEAHLEKMRVQEFREQKKREEAEKQKLKQKKQHLEQIKQQQSTLEKPKPTEDPAETFQIIEPIDEDKEPNLHGGDKEGKGEIVDKVIGALKTTDANEIMKMIRARRRKNSTALQMPPKDLRKPGAKNNKTRTSSNLDTMSEVNEQA